MRPAAEGSNITRKQHFEQIQKSSGRIRPELQIEPLPESLAYLWEWFFEVQNGERLSWIEIESWNRQTCKNLTAKEAGLIRRLSTIQQESRNE